MLRAKISPETVSVIPNAVDTTGFAPPVAMKGLPWGTVLRGGPPTVVVLTRLVYRKGVDLLVDVIPGLCARHPGLRFVIGGDGPRRLQLVQMIERHALFDRVEMLGALEHSQIKSTLNRGQIFLNCSLTEAFCIAILEAAACGLLAVSTRVGGVPEVLPPSMLYLAEPDPASLIAALERAIARVPYVSPWSFHESVSSFYSWRSVAERTEKIYKQISSVDCPALRLSERIRRYVKIGPVYGLLCVAIAVVDWVLLQFLIIFYPKEDMDMALDLQKRDEVILGK